MIYQKQMMIQEWERQCFIQQEMTKLQRWMISTFLNTASKWIHPDAGVLVHNVGDALQLEQCKKISIYRIHLNRKINDTCYHDFPISIPSDNTARFLKIFDRQVVRTSSITLCKNLPSLTYLRDYNSEYYLITSEGNVSAFTIQETSLKETATIKLKEIRGFDKRLLSPAPHYLEPYTMLNIFTYVQEAMQEVKQLQTNHGDGNVLLGIGRALGATIESLAKGGSTIKTAVGFALHGVLNGVGNLDEKVVNSFGTAASSIIHASGTAIKDTSTGIGNIFHGILGGIGGTIKWVLILLIIISLMYLNKESIIKFLRKKKKKKGPSTLVPPNIPETTQKNQIKPIKPTPVIHQEDNKESNGMVNTPETNLLSISKINLRDGSRSEAVQAIVTIYNYVTQLQVKALIDTGSVTTIINKDLYLKITNKHESLTSTDNKGICFISASNHKIPIIGEDEIKIQIAEKTFLTTVFIAPNIPHDIILGLPTLIEMKLKVNLEE